MKRAMILFAPWLGLAVGMAGCQHPSVSAVSLNPEACGPECGSFWGVVHHCLKSKEEGIPFYLPKPLLIIAKNFRNMEQTQVGLTAGAPIPNYFDDQSKYADLNSRSQFIGPDTKTTGPAIVPSGSNVIPADTGDSATAAAATIYPGSGAPMSPGAAPSDGLKPDAFYTYHIVFVPDLTQKFGLKVKGGVGEIRAAMNLVNGWQFTGLGPFYMKDSSTAQDTLASGIAANLALNGVGNVVKQLTDLRSAAGQAPAIDGTKKAALGDTPEAPAGVLRVMKSVSELDLTHCDFSRYAEIHVYEAYLTPEGGMEWRPIADHTMSRDVIGAIQEVRVPTAAPQVQTQQSHQPSDQDIAPSFQPATSGISQELRDDIIRRRLGIPIPAAAPAAAPAMAPATAPVPGSVTIPAIPVIPVAPTLPAANPQSVAGGPLRRLFGNHKHRQQPLVRTDSLLGSSVSVTPAQPPETPGTDTIGRQP